MQESFSRLWDNYSTDEDAKRARKERVRELRTKGYKVNTFVLKNQIKK